MLVHKRMRRPELECLEARWVPATIKLVSGSLFISNQTAALTVTATATAGKFNVTDGAKTVTVSGVGSLISITGTNNADKITVDLINKTFGGNVLINSGNGDDTVTLTAAAAGGKIGGNLTVLMGNGTDFLQTPPGTGVQVGGNTYVDGGLGADKFFFGDVPFTKFGGDLSINNVNNVGANLPASIGGNLTLTATDGLANSWRLAVTVGKSASLTSGSGNDEVYLAGFGALSGSVAGNVTMSLGGGDNKAGVAPLFGTAGNFDIGGNLSIYGGAGADDLRVADAGDLVTVGGNTIINGGEGANGYRLGATWSAFGNVLISGGNGVNDLSGATNSFFATVAGNLSFQFGNGNNLITLGASSSVAGKLNVLTGNGDNNLTLLGAQTYNANVRFGSGDDTVTLNNAALVLTGFLDGGAGNNKLDQMAGTLSPYLTLVNF